MKIRRRRPVRIDYYPKTKDDKRSDIDSKQIDKGLDSNLHKVDKEYKEDKQNIIEETIKTSIEKIKEDIKEEIKNDKNIDLEYNKIEEIPEN